MQYKHAPLFSFLLVVGIHVGVLAAVVMSPSAPKPIDISPPTIQGVLVMVAEPEPVPKPIIQETPPPPPEKKPEPKPKPKPIPKAPPSERAVKAPEPEPTPVQPVAEPKPVAAEPAPVIPPSADAGQLSNPAPTYPSLSRRLREEGVVLLEILIKADGSVGEIKLKESSGFKRLDDTAIKAVAKWRYQPATQGGMAIDYWYEQPVEFTLH